MAKACEVDLLANGAIGFTADRQRSGAERTLGGARVGARCDREGAERTRIPSGLGGFGGSAGSSRRVFARIASALRQVRLQGRAVRTFRARLHPLPGLVRTRHGPGRRALALVYERGVADDPSLPADRFRESTATVKRAASFSRSCTAKRSSRHSAVSNASGIRRAG